MELHERLARLRAKHQWCFRELRERIQAETGELVALSYLWTLESGADVSPTINALVKIAAAYDMTVQELIAPVTFPKEHKS